MKNQYVGDIGDYGKYGLLRFISNSGIRIGVNWYLTKNDEHIVDGNIRGYLKDDAESVYDCKVYELLKNIPNRDIGYIEKSGILSNSIYYNEELSFEGVPPNERKAVRTRWHSKGMKALEDTDIVFADPDNGSTEDKKGARKNGEKYITIREIADYYQRGQNIVYYCHRARRNQESWQKKMIEIKTECPDAEIIVLTFHRGTQRSYIFCVHPSQFEEYDCIVEDFLSTAWGRISADGKKQPPFTRER